MDPVLGVAGLTLRYGDEDVLNDVSFRLDAGEIAFLTGPNGSGKSTLLRCLAGWAPPYAGSIELCGRAFKGDARDLRAQVAFVPDVPVFYDDLTAEEHVRFMLDAGRRRGRSDYVDWLFDAFDLDRVRNRLPSSFSRGMREKLGLLIAFAAQPRLLLLDEPYGPLDRQVAVALSEEIAAVAEEGTAVILSCHQDIPLLEPDKLLCIESGRLLEGKAAGKGGVQGEPASGEGVSDVR